MKTFRSVKKYLAVASFIEGKDRFNSQQSINALKGFVAIIMQCLYLVFDAVTVKQYLDSIFMSTGGLIRKLKVLMSLL